MVRSNRPRPVIAVAGTDKWLRPRLFERLAGMGYEVRDRGLGTASLFDVDVLVQVPAMAPMSGSGARDTGLSPAIVTFSAMATSSVGRAVVVSRVGVDDGVSTSYLNSLRALEHRAMRATSKLTVIRLAHPFGPLDSPGPIADAIAQWSPQLETVTQDDVTTQPVYVDDVLEVALAAVDGRIGTGIVEVGGPDRLSLQDFAKLAASARGAALRPSGPHLLRKRGYDEAMRGFLRIDSVTARKFAPPLELSLHRLVDVWRDHR